MLRTFSEHIVLLLTLKFLKSVDHLCVYTLFSNNITVCYMQSKTTVYMYCNDLQCKRTDTQLINQLIWPLGESTQKKNHSIARIRIGSNRYFLNFHVMTEIEGTSEQAPARGEIALLLLAISNTFQIRKKSRERGTTQCITFLNTPNHCLFRSGGGSEPGLPLDVSHGICPLRNSSF